MPHIIVKLWPGKSEEEKTLLAEKFTQAMKETMDIADKSISIAIMEVPKEKWMEEVYQPDISNNECLYKKPGY